MGWTMQGRLVLRNDRAAEKGQWKGPFCSSAAFFSTRRSTPLRVHASRPFKPPLPRRATVTSGLLSLNPIGRDLGSRWRGGKREGGGEGRRGCGWGRRLTLKKSTAKEPEQLWVKERRKRGVVCTGVGWVVEKGGVGGGGGGWEAGALIS